MNKAYNNFLFKDFDFFIKDLKKKKFNFVLISNLKKKKSYKKEILLRHDIDFSPQNAIKIAKIEKKNKVYSTFYIQILSPFYSINLDKNLIYLKNIIELGHNIGLHFDASSYKIKSEKDLIKFLNLEKKILARLLDLNIRKIKSFSFHNPSKRHLNFKKFKYANMINCYSDYIKSRYYYFSDSNGYWKKFNIKNFFIDHEKIQFLSHPIWWNEKKLIPRDKIIFHLFKDFIGKINSYDSLLQLNSRKNKRNNKIFKKLRHILNEK